MEYAIRIHKDSISTEKLQKLLEDLEGSYVFVEENANRVHYQGIIKTDISQNTLKQRILRSLNNNRGNKAYSLKQVREPDNYLRYLMKGDSHGVMPVIIAKQSIKLTNDQIIKLHNDFWDIKNNTKDKSKNMIEFLYDKLKVYEHNDKQSITKDVIHYYKINNKPMNTFYIKSQIRLLLCKLSNSYELELINQIVEEL